MRVLSFETDFLVFDLSPVAFDEWLFFGFISCFFQLVGNVVFLFLHSFDVFVIDFGSSG